MTKTQKGATSYEINPPNYDYNYNQSSQKRQLERAFNTILNLILAMWCVFIVAVGGAICR